MAQSKKVITKINRYLDKVEAYYIMSSLNEFNYENKLIKLFEDVYMIELPNIDKNDKKSILKEELQSIGFNIYKTNKTLEELREIETNKNNRS